MSCYSPANVAIPSAYSRVAFAPIHSTTKTECSRRFFNGSASRIVRSLNSGWDGTANNTVYLLLSGWRGLWIDGSQSNADAVNRQFATFLRSGSLVFLHKFVNRDTINDIIGGANFSGEIDLLSIDIDGNDYWVWEAISVVRPRAVVIEYNAVFRPPMRSRHLQT